jgi:hemolysin-activating ACP:hemolysin acyltransferase
MVHEELSRLILNFCCMNFIENFFELALILAKDILHDNSDALGNSIWIIQWALSHEEIP